VSLFVEELTRAVLESGIAKLTGREIPVTLHDSLMARLDQLGPAKEVAQVGGEASLFRFLDAESRAKIATRDRNELLANSKDPRVREFLNLGQEGGESAGIYD
jgi:hypothetical protein